MDNSTTIAYNKSIGLCDMILSISVKEINALFKSLFTGIYRGSSVFTSNWNVCIGFNGDVHVNLTDSNGKIISDPTKFANRIGVHYQNAFCATINPNITIDASNEENHKVKMTIPFDSGTFYYWKQNPNDPSSNEQATVPITSRWKYVFEVNLNKISKKATEIDWGIPGMQHQFQSILGDTGLKESDFDIASLFLDFENTEGLTYIPSESYLGTNSTVKTHVDDAMKGYLTALQKEGKNFLLGQVPTLSNTAIEGLFIPTGLKFSVTYNEADKDESTINFLMMTNWRKFSTKQSLGILPQTLLKKDATGKYFNGYLGIDSALFYQAIFKLLPFDIKTTDNPGLIDKLLGDINISEYQSKAIVSLSRADQIQPQRGAVQFQNSQAYPDKKTWCVGLWGGGSTNHGNKGVALVEYTAIYPTWIFFKYEKNSGKKLKIAPMNINFSFTHRAGFAGIPNYLFDYSIDTEIVPNATTQTYPIGLGLCFFLKSHQILGDCLVNEMQITKSIQTADVSTTIPQTYFFLIKAGIDGKLIFAKQDADTITGKHNVSGGITDASGQATAGSNFSAIFSHLQEVETSTVSKVNKLLKNIGLNKVILPLSKSYTYKNVSFNLNPLENDSTDVHAGFDVTYQVST